MRLRLDPREGLVVTVPLRFDQSRVPALISAREDWIREKLSQHAAARAEIDPGRQGRRPEQVALPALGREWQIVYRDQSGTRLRFVDDGQRLSIGLPEGPAHEVDDRLARRLQRWLRQQAEVFLQQRVSELSAACALPYRSVTIRNQRARWGSCSTAGDLSLNARLLFCPPTACDYVVVHELVHTIHPNHSADFWAEVGRVMPDFRSRMDVLGRVWLRLPDWV